MVHENGSDLYHQIFWSISHEIKISSQKQVPFLNTFSQKLSKSGWNLFDNFKSNQNSVAIVNSFTKPHHQLLTIGMNSEESNISVSWQQKLNPKLGREISLAVIVIFIVSSIFRLIFPLNHIGPLFFLVIGLIIVLGILVYYVYLFDRSLIRNSDIAVAFLETLLEFGDP